MKRDVFGKECKPVNLAHLAPEATVLTGRKSTRNESSAKSLSDQRECAFETAAELGISVLEENWWPEAAGHGGDEWWEGGGASGLNGDQSSPGKTRPVFTKIMQGVQAGTIKCVIVWSLDRLWRSTAICAQAVDIMAKSGCLLVDRNGIVDISTPEGRTAVFSNAVNAQNQREQGTVNSPRGVLKSRSKGKIVGPNNSLGFRSAGHRTGEIVHMEEEQELVRRIFRLFYAGEDETGPLPVGQIALRLMDEGYIWTPDLHHKRAIVRDANTRGVIYPKQIMFCLKDVRYIGKQLSYGEAYDCPNFLNNGQPIVPIDLFNCVQDKFRQNKRGSNAAVNTYALSGRVRCGLCYQPLVAQLLSMYDKSGVPFKRAFWQKRPGRPIHWCKHSLPTIQHVALDDYVDRVLAPLLMEEIRDRRRDNEDGGLEQKRSSLQRELEEAERHYREELPKYHRTKIDPEIFEAMQIDAKQQITDLRARLREVVSESQTFAHAISALQSLPDAPPALRRDALRSVIQWIAVLPTVITEGNKRLVHKDPTNIANLVFLTTWGTYHTARLYRRCRDGREPNEDGHHANRFCLRPATLAEMIGGVADFPQPEQFYEGLVRACRGRWIEVSPEKMFPGYSPGSASKVAEFDLPEYVGSDGDSRKKGHKILGKP